MLRTVRGVGVRGVIAVAALLVTVVATAGDELRIHDAWMPEVPPVARAVAGYMTLENHGDEPWVLIGAGSHRFDKVMVHSTVEESGVARMVHEDEVVIPPGETVAFDPGGLHLMLIGPHKPLDRGESVDIILVFQGGAEVPVRFRVGKKRVGEGEHTP